MIKYARDFGSDTSYDTGDSNSEEEYNGLSGDEQLDALCASLYISESGKEGVSEIEINLSANGCNTQVHQTTSPTWSAWDEYSDLLVRYALNLRIVRVEDHEGNSISTFDSATARSSGGSTVGLPDTSNYSRSSSGFETSVGYHKLFFVLRISDVETKKRWLIRKSLRELVAFYDCIKSISGEDAPVKEPFWGTFRSLRPFKLSKRILFTRSLADIEQQKILFDSFLRHTAALVSPAPLGPRRRRAILTLQQFVEVNRHCMVSERQACCICHSPWRDERNVQRDVENLFQKHPIFIEFEKFVASVTRQAQGATRRRKKAFTPPHARNILKNTSAVMRGYQVRLCKDAKFIRYIDERGFGLSEDDHEKFIDNARHAVTAIVEKAVYIQLEDHVYEALRTITSEETESTLKEKFCCLQDMPQSYFGISTQFVSKNDWEFARHEFRQLDDYALPIDKVRCIVRAAKAIFHTCSVQPADEPEHPTSKRNKSSSFTSVEEMAGITDESGLQVSSPSRTRALAADDFLPIHLFVVVTTNTSKPLITKQLLQIMCRDPHDMLGEIGYYLTNYEAAIRFVKELQHSSQRTTE
uniref:Uncharacterized protein AlNc14C187G8346 n=1 Tax=Albugo laibachii Nc14 TaxID=890382 RepID=F0WPK1_9STRA|nr:conserved hypothetical protein [Albugo laibachii Nc14]|eukprot:CCA23251.1 conserved hypothetical protein [Albugo laibachii Nc14]